MTPLKILRLILLILYSQIIAIHRNSKGKSLSEMTGACQKSYLCSFHTSQLFNSLRFFKTQLSYISLITY